MGLLNSQEFCAPLTDTKVDQRIRQGADRPPIHQRGTAHDILRTWARFFRNESAKHPAAGLPWRTPRSGTTLLDGSDAHPACRA